MTGKKVPTTIGGFQASTVEDVPVVARAARGIYNEIIDAVPDSPKALKLEIGDSKKASTRVTGLRGFLRRHNLTEQFTVVRSGGDIFIAREAETKPGTPPKKK